MHPQNSVDLLPCEGLDILPVPSTNINVSQEEFQPTLSSLKESNPLQGNQHPNNSWECKICKKLLKVASPQSHLMHYHDMTYAEYQKSHLAFDNRYPSSKQIWLEGETERIRAGDHPSYITMVMEAITAIKANPNKRNGASRHAIVNYLKDNYSVGMNAKLIYKNVDRTLVEYVRKGVLAYAHQNNSLEIVDDNIIQRTNMKRWEISQLLDKGVPQAQVARALDCSIDSVRYVFARKKEGKVFALPRHNSDNSKAEVSPLPATNNQANCMPSTPPNQILKNESSNPGNHPPYITMVKEAITAIRAQIKWNRNGASRQAIVNYIADNYNVGSNTKLINSRVKQALRNYVEKGVLAYTSDNSKGACGSFKVVTVSPTTT